MSDRNTSEKADSISLFPFLAVLLCTMGALLVLLVVLVDRAAKRAVLAMEHPVSLATADVPDNSVEIAELREELDKLTDYRKKIAKIEAEGQTRLQKERERLEQVEAGARELERELAKLAIAAQQLNQASEDREVDQQQAETEAQRLEKLVAETEDQVEEIRKSGTGSKSYAIVPYKGVNGTFRKPVYIECDKDGVTIQPEGLRLTRADFAAVKWAGNPLASVLRATREYLNSRAMQAGESQPPDPYPMLIVRPSGIDQYLFARAAITSWDSDYGYEFIEEDTQLTYRDMPDPLLAQTQEHALMIARDRLVHMAQAAPRRFRGVAIGREGDGSVGRSSPGDGAWGGGSNGNVGTLFGNGENATDSLVGDRYTSETTTETDVPGGSGSGAGSAGGSGHAGENSSLGNLAHGRGEGMSGEGDGSAGSGQQPGGTARYSSGEIAGGSATPQQNGTSAYRQAPSGIGGGTEQSGSTSQQMAGAGGSSGNSSFGSSASNPSQGVGQSVSFTAGGVSQSLTQSRTDQARSIAETQGHNWAVHKTSRHAIPIQRTIGVAVRRGQVALLPEAYNLSRAAEQGAVISLEQSSDQIAAEFTKAFQDRVEQWGIAGNGMYWRPVLEVTVGPDAVETAHELQKLLEDSGVEINLRRPSVRNAAAPAQEGILR